MNDDERTELHRGEERRGERKISDDQVEREREESVWRRREERENGEIEIKWKRVDSLSTTRLC